MTDYDWIRLSRPVSPSTIGPIVRSAPHSLDWYLNGSVAFGRDLPISDALTVNVNGGLQYTDVEWTATGGTYIYSNAAFRDSDWVAAGRRRRVRYRQQLPTAFVGTDAMVKDGAWSLDATAKAGLVLMARSTDWHYLRVPPRYQVDHLNFAQVLQADARLGYDFSDHLSAFLEGSYQKMYLRAGADRLHPDVEQRFADPRRSYRWCRARRLVV